VPDKKPTKLLKAVKREEGEDKLAWEIICVLVQTIWFLVTGVIDFIWNNLSLIIEIKQIATYFTPLGFVAAIIGVPLFVVKSAGVAINRLIN